MRILVQDAAPTFAHIVNAMAIDPISWEKWLVLYINTTQKPQEKELNMHAYIASEIGQLMPDLDGTAYLCDDQHCFILCRNIAAYQLRHLGYELSHSLQQNHDIKSIPNLYEPASDWRSLVSMCDTHRYHENNSAELSLSSDVLGHSIIDLLDAFAINRMRRELRVPVRVMLVEDDPFARKIVSKCLKKNQQLITASTAEEAVMQYMLNAPDIVFLDIGLPDHDGFSVIDTIKAHDPDAYIVMFSGNSYADHIARSLCSGAKGFVGKPFRKERLFHYIDDYKQNRAV